MHRLMPAPAAYVWAPSGEWLAIQLPETVGQLVASFLGEVAEGSGAGTPVVEDGELRIVFRFVIVLFGGLRRGVVVHHAR